MHSKSNYLSKAPWALLTLQSGAKITINFQHVIAVVEDKEMGVTVIITLTEGEAYRVKETITEIENKLAGYETTDK